MRRHVHDAFAPLRAAAWAAGTAMLSGPPGSFRNPDPLRLEIKAWCPLPAKPRGTLRNR